jgi:glycine oxidase
VPRSDGRVLAGSTLENAGFEKVVTPAGLEKIMHAAAELIPTLADAETVETWAGLRPGTPDDLPILGPTDAEGLFVATGHYRNGILLAPITAKLVAEWVTGQKLGLDVDRFSPLRFAAPPLPPAR